MNDGDERTNHYNAVLRYLRKIILDRGMSQEDIGRVIAQLAETDWANHFDTFSRFAHFLGQKNIVLPT